MTTNKGGRPRKGLTTEERQWVRQVMQANPEFGTRRIADAINNRRGVWRTDDLVKRRRLMVSEWVVRRELGRLLPAEMARPARRAPGDCAWCGEAAEVRPVMRHGSWHLLCFGCEKDSEYLARQGTTNGEKV